MKSILLTVIPIIFLACSQNGQKEETHQKELTKPVTKKDSIINLEIRAKPGEQFFFGYTDSLFNFNIIETPEKLKVDSVFRNQILSFKPVLLKDIHWDAENYIYLVPGETYRITKDSGFSNFEVVGAPERSYELNALKELRRHAKSQNRYTEVNVKNIPRYKKFTAMEFTARDSILKSYYDDDMRFLDDYTAKNNFDPKLKKIFEKNLFYRYQTAHFNFRMDSPDKVKKYLNENKNLYNGLLPLMLCDSCFADPDFPYVTQVFATSFVADPAKVGVEKAYTAYADFFQGKTRDYLLYNLIKLGGMFNSTKPNPALAQRFLTDAHDPNLKAYIKEMYDFLEMKKSATGKLVDMSGRDITWDKMLEKHKGKVVYVDFWASWCGPCRAEAPASILLKKHFQEKDVVFVNISLDENSAAWKKASQHDGIVSPENYILVQPQKSELTKKYRISSIPRYLLINKKGKVINANAVRPSDKEITDEIQHLL